MNKQERVEFDKCKEAFQTQLERFAQCRQTLVQFQSALASASATLSNQKQEIANLTLERTSLFQALWDLQKERKKLIGEIEQLKTSHVMQFSVSIRAAASNEEASSENL